MTSASSRETVVLTQKKLEPQETHDVPQTKVAPLRERNRVNDVTTDVTPLACLTPARNMTFRKDDLAEIASPMRRETYVASASPRQTDIPLRGFRTQSVRRPLIRSPRVRSRSESPPSTPQLACPLISRNASQFSDDTFVLRTHDVTASTRASPSAKRDSHVIEQLSPQKRVGTYTKLDSSLSPKLDRDIDLDSLGDLPFCSAATNSNLTEARAPKKLSIISERSNVSRDSLDALFLVTSSAAQSASLEKIQTKASDRRSKEECLETCDVISVTSEPASLYKTARTSPWKPGDDDDDVIVASHCDEFVTGCSGIDACDIDVCDVKATEDNSLLMSSLLQQKLQHVVANSFHDDSFHDDDVDDNKENQPASKARGTSTFSF